MIISGLAFGCPAILETLCLLVFAVIPVQVTTSAGETIEGELGELTESQLSLSRDGEIIEFGFDELVSLEQVGAAEQTRPNLTITLLDGSRIAAQEVSLAEEKLTIVPRRQTPLQVELNAVKSIRFSPAAPGTDAQWLGLLDREAGGDLLAIRREGERIDPYTGIVEAIRDGVVTFKLGDDNIKAPINRLEGVVFGGTRKVDETSSIAIRDVYGSQWSVDSIAPTQQGDAWRITLGSGIEHELPLTHVLTVRWSGGLQLLAKLDPAVRAYKPFIDTKVDSTLLEDWFAPQSANAADITLRGNSSIEYRVEPEYSKLVGTVGRDNAVRQAGELVFSILLDGDVKWQEKVVGKERLGFELPIEGARRVQFKSDSGNDGDVGDTVLVSRPRFVK